MIEEKKLETSVRELAMLVFWLRTSTKAHNAFGLDSCYSFADEIENKYTKGEKCTSLKALARTAFVR